MEDLIIFKKSYDFSKWLFRHTNKFPKSFRFSLAVRLENGMLDFLRAIILANHRKNKLPLLIKADEELITMRLMLRFNKLRSLQDSGVEIFSSFLRLTTPRNPFELSAAMLAKIMGSANPPGEARYFGSHTGSNLSLY